MSTTIALVTGANRGIGLAVVRGLAKSNQFHVIATARTQEAADGIAKQMKEEGLDAKISTYAPLDVANDDHVKAVEEHVRKNHGELGVLVNNAGVLLDAKTSFADSDPSTVLKSIDINCMGAARMILAFTPHFEKTGFARVVNMSSGMGGLGADGITGSNALGYRISKAAMNALTRTTHFAFAKLDNAQVHSMCPGFVDTDMTSVFGGGRLTPDEGADTAVWLSTRPKGFEGGRFFRSRKEIQY